MPNCHSSVPFRSLGLGLLAAALLLHCSIDDSDRAFGDDENGEGGERASGGRSASGNGGSSASTSPENQGGRADAGAPASEGGEASGTGGAAEDPMATGGRNDGDAGAPGSDCTTRCNALGDPCESPNDCQSGLCADGVCCESRCDDVCQACSTELTGAANGECAPVLRDSDPHDDCEDEALATCGRNGLCDGDGACALHPEDTICGVGRCAADEAVTPRTCDGNGTCRNGAEVVCEPYACGGDVCRTTCNENSHCANGFVCVGSSCEEPSELLDACDDTDDCTQGECVYDRCVLFLDSIGIEGTAVNGGGDPQTSTRGWFSSDASGQNRVEVSEMELGRLWTSLDIRSHFDPALPPDTYLLLTGAESSEPLTRTFQFDFSDGTGVSKEVSANSSEDIILYAEATVGSGDDFVLFHFTGADVEVLRKSY